MNRQVSSQIATDYSFYLTCGQMRTAGYIGIGIGLLVAFSRLIGIPKGAGVAVLVGISICLVVEGAIGTLRSRK